MKTIQLQNNNSLLGQLENIRKKERFIIRLARQKQTVKTFLMICVSVYEKKCCVIRIDLYIFDGWNVLLFLEVFYSFWHATLLFHISRGKQVCH